MIGFRIKHNYMTQFLGRNGAFLCTGFTFMRTESVPGGAITIWPITSKGEDGRCFIEVAVNDLDEFIQALREEAKRD